MPDSSSDYADLDSANERVKRRLRDRTTAILRDIKLASMANRVRSLFLNHRSVSVMSGASDDHHDLAVLNGYQRHIFEFSADGRLMVSTALLGGIHALAANEYSAAGMAAKVSMTGSLHPEVVEACESLLRDPDVSEEDAFRTLSQYLRLFPGGEEQYMYPQIIFEPQPTKPRALSFFFEGTTLDEAAAALLASLKLPTQRVLLDPEDCGRFYGELRSYLVRMRECRLSGDGSTQENEGLEGEKPPNLRARLVLIIGRDYSDRDFELVQRVRDSIPSAEWKTFDDIRDFGRELLDAFAAGSDELRAEPFPEALAAQWRTLIAIATKVIDAALKAERCPWPVRGLVRRALSLTRAMALLIQQDLWMETMALGRSSFEIEIVLKWLFRGDRDQKLSDYVEAIAAETERLKRKIAAEKSVAAMVLSDLLGEEYRKPSPTSKTRRPATVRDMAIETDMEGHYDFGYWMESSFVHATPLSLLDEAPDDMDSVLVNMYSATGSARGLAYKAIPDQLLHLFEAIDLGLSLGLAKDIGDARSAVHRRANAIAAAMRPEADRTGLV